jgi:hypothetical protein
LANTGDVAEGLMTVLDLQKPLVNDLYGQGAQKVLKMTRVHCFVKVVYVELNRFEFQIT